MRTALLAAIAAVVFAAGTSAAPAEVTSWSAYVAPAGACPGADDAQAPAQTQKRAMTCLINWTRGRAGLRRLRWSDTLAYAAGSKADIIARCADFSHHPCGTRWPAIATQQHRYSIWGENLFYGQKAVASPRAALVAWLNSPEHRAILFGRAWRDLGVTVQRARELEGNKRVWVWVLEVAGQV